MDYQLTIPAMARRAEQVHPHKTVVSRRPDASIQRATYGACLQRARRLAGALRELGIGDDDRVATLCWNHQQHFEAYVAIPSMGAVLHTLNIRLHADELAYVADHAADRIVIVDRSLLPLLERFRGRTKIEHVIVVDGGTDIPTGMYDYETLIASAAEMPFDDTIGERRASSTCYTSGTTGRPKGVLYSHRSTVMHSLVSGLWDAELVREREVVLPMVPMFHANAWGLPYSCLLYGANQVLPGPHVDPVSLLELIVGERVTVSAGVPTVWLAMLQTLDANPDTYDLSCLRTLTSGGSAVPESLIRAYQERHGVTILQGWGMTEMSPIGTLATLSSVVQDADPDTKYRIQATGGRTLPFVELRVRSDAGIAPWDGATMGEIEVRGPFVASGYYGSDDGASRFSDDGWFKTGDLATIEPGGYVTIRDRAKDVIKSGGEWISSVALENALMKHPAVLEAAVIGLAHPTWDERPLALVVPRAGSSCTPAELSAHLLADFVKFWIPSAFEFVNDIPRTSVGKVDKLSLRARYRDHFMIAPAAAAPSTSAAPLTS